MSYAKDRDQLITWYRQNKRILPWRSSRDPYRIWISEVMLQQTTVAAVIPFYEKFLNRFPNVHVLAKAELEDVYEYWAGLGYYSRARNLHLSAKNFSAQGFPQTAAGLIENPGLGPYTSRAIASLAFNEPVGVLDGNVIRVLSRRYGLKLKWWETKSKQQLQMISDELAKSEFNADVNQGLMELGATICTPKKTLCLMCPWKKSCIALQNNLISELPLKKEKEKFQTWLWTFDVDIQKSKIYLQPNHETPFLKKLLLPISKAKLVTEKPKSFDFKHGVTKYDIYVTLKKPKNSPQKGSKAGLWANIDSISKINPTSLMKKILSHHNK